MPARLVLPSLVLAVLSLLPVGASAQERVPPGARGSATLAPSVTLVVERDRAYVLDATSGAPVERAPMTLRARRPASGRIHLHGTMAYVVCDRGIAMIDVSTPADPRLLSIETLAKGRIDHVTFDGDRIYVSKRLGRTTVVDVIWLVEPTRPMWLIELLRHEHTARIEVVDGLAFHGDRELVITDVSAPGSSFDHPRVPLSAPITRIERQPGRVVITAGETIVVDITDRAAPRVLLDQNSASHSESARHSATARGERTRQSILFIT